MFSNKTKTFHSSFCVISSVVVVCVLLISHHLKSEVRPGKERNSGQEDIGLNLDIYGIIDINDQRTFFVAASLHACSTRPNQRLLGQNFLSACDVLTWPDLIDHRCRIEWSHNEPFALDWTEEWKTDGRILFVLCFPNNTDCLQCTISREVESQRLW